MFVRKKKNKSGIVSVQVIDKSSGNYKVVKTIGSSCVESEVEQLLTEGRNWIIKQRGLQEIDFTNHRKHTEQILDGIIERSNRGTELLPGKLFDEIGSNAQKLKLSLN